jgi:PAS domain S-box-containing protein
MQPPRFSFFNISLKHRLPLLIGALLLAILAASAWASYRAVSASALEVGRERLVSLTEQLASQSQQSVPLLLSNTFTAANDPATRAFLQDPSPATRAGALALLQQFVTAEDKGNLQVELWNASKSLALVIPNGAPESVDLSIEFKQCTVDPFRAVGAIRILKEVIAYPAVAAVKDGRGTPIGFLVRWRRVSSTPNTRKQIGDLLGSDAVLYFGNSEGNIWTDLEKVVPKPAGGLQSTLEVKHYLHDGTPVMGMGRAINGTPWFVVVEFPDHVFLKQANRVRRRMILIGLVLFVIGIAGAFSLSRTITQPLESLTNAALAVTRGDYSHTVDIRQGNELGDLASAFNVMVGQVGESKRELEGKVLEHERAKEAASKLAAIIESSDDAIIGKTLEGVVTSWNQGAEKLYGYSAEQVLGRSVSILVPPENTDELSNILERLKRGERINHRETERITKTGKRIQVSFTVSPIRDSSGQISGASTIARDISERKMAQAAQQASDFRYRRLFESAKDGILFLQENTGQIIDANPYLLKMLGYSCAEIAGKKLWEIGCFKDVAASKEAFAHLQKQGYIRYENLPLQTSDGHIRQVEFVSNRYLVGDEQVLQCNVRDITDRRQSETDLKEANQSLELALKKVQEKSDELASTTQQLWQASKLATMGELAASVAHELNNPLATVALRAESALEGMPPEDPQRHGLEVISQEVDRMATLVGNLLVFSRRSVRQLSTLDLREELINSLNFIQYHLRSHKIDVVQEFSIDLPTVQADQQQLRQVFLNLITNACDAMPKGGTLSVRSRAGVMAGLAAVVIEFADTGIGVQTGDLPRLWEPFFTTKPAGKGTGLGLAICRRTVEEHRGTIEIETGPGKGTTVRITLPATGESLEVAA